MLPIEYILKLYLNTFDSWRVEVWANPNVTFFGRTLFSAQTKLIPFWGVRKRPKENTTGDGSFGAELAKRVEKYVGKKIKRPSPSFAEE